MSDKAVHLPLWCRYMKSWFQVIGAKGRFSGSLFQRLLTSTMISSDTKILTVNVLQASRNEFSLTLETQTRSQFMTISYRKLIFYI